MSQLSHVGQFSSIQPFSFTSFLSSRSHLNIRSSRRPYLRIFDPSAYNGNTLQYELLNQFLQPLSKERQYSEVVLRLV